MAKLISVKEYREKLHEFEKLVKQFDAWKVDVLPKHALVERKKLIRQARKLIIANRKVLINYGLKKGNLDQLAINKSYETMDKLIEDFIARGIVEKA